MPTAVTNNATALVHGSKGTELYSFNGLSAGKKWQDIHNRGYQFANKQWTQIPAANSSQAVLASTAVSIGKKIYMMGGYTVNAKGEEKSMPNVFLLDSKSLQWSVVSQMPIPVDDTVALVYQHRYIYLVSGWHDDDNVSSVQVFDTENNTWQKATDYPAPAVFGHAGGIVINTLVICDGVKVVANNNSRDFVSSPVCMKGTINVNNPAIIDWQSIKHHSKIALYRMAATGDTSNGRIIFAGGSNNPYNYDGIGYNGIASEASDLVFSYDIASSRWREYKGLIPKTMDHRALLSDGHWFYIVGGMQSEQKVSSQILKFKIPNYN